MVKVVWRWYSGLPPKGKFYVGLGLMTWGTVGLWLNEKAERYFGVVPIEEDWQELRDMVQKVTDKVPKIISVDKKDR